MPYHLLLDGANEQQLGKYRIGTTGRGIGPCYADKAARLGIRVQDLLDEKILRAQGQAALQDEATALLQRYDIGASTPTQVTEELLGYARAPRAVHLRRERSWSTTPSTRASTSSSRAPRARCSTSTTAPIRS